MFKSLIFIPRNRRAVGKLSEVNLVTSLLVSSGNAENLELFWYQAHSDELQRKTTQNTKLALSTSPRTQNLKRMAYKNETRDYLTPSKHSGVCAEHFTENSFKQNKAITSVIETLFQASSTCTQERCGTDDFEILIW